ncbi:4263_t:CDS:2 [Paraglomus occultum]|uniref:4263_t:CDS:1 n=1 Tax=Paraglomus occultum TaxID=144539 RepID=A0A9N9A6W6_9GLOM|nr:4263_t:CDS:2 [Paraglomus occultum]
MTMRLLSSKLCDSSFLVIAIGNSCLLLSRLLAVVPTKVIVMNETIDEV